MIEPAELRRLAEAQENGPYFSLKTNCEALRAAADQIEALSDASWVSSMLQNVFGRKQQGLWPMTDLQSLHDRVVGGEVGRGLFDSDIDDEIARATGRRFEVRPYTTSANAALALKEAVCPDADLFIRQEARCIAEVTLEWLVDDRGQTAEADAPTLPAAIVAAVLKAKMKELEDGRND